MSVSTLRYGLIVRNTQLSWRRSSQISMRMFGSRARISYAIHLRGPPKPIKPTQLGAFPVTTIHTRFSSTTPTPTMSSSTTKVAIVTGAAQGIGRSVAIQLAEDGFAVVVSDIASKQDLMDAVATEIKAKDATHQAIVVPADVSSQNDVDNLITKTKDAFGGLDVMVANAGVCWPKTLLELTVEELEKLFAINVRGVFLCYQAAARLMIEQNRGGRIIGASSIAGKKGSPSTGAYCASKFAVRALTQTAAAEWGPHGITVNAYAPGTTDTPMLREAAENIKQTAGIDLLAQYKASTCLHRVGDAEEIANVVSFLASPKSSYVTGQTITIDGGVWFD